MKKVTIFLIVVLITIHSNSQIGKTMPIENDSPQKLTPVNYRLFPTQNFWTFIKLNTRNGQMWQVQFDTKGSSRFESILNAEVLAPKEKEQNDRFILYSTQNTYTFILLDQLDGRLWQVQWSLEANNRFIIPIE